MSNADKVKDIAKFLGNILPFCDEEHAQCIRFEARKHNGEWTVHNFKLEKGEKVKR